jgi:putative ATP-dependent endonuclease of the OLD family
MYLSKIRLWNFRKFGGGGDIISDDKGRIRNPDLEVELQNGLNVLIGENDSGKTAIIDAVKLALRTHSAEYIRVEFEDFYESTNHLRIECIFRGFEERDYESMHFTEWLGMEGDGASATPYLRVIMDIKHNGDRILLFEVRAGVDDTGSILPMEARDYLKATYLRPLRDAQQELIPKRNSRLSQILEGHEVFKGKADTHELKTISRCFNCLVQKYFDRDYKDEYCKETECPLKDRFLQLASSGKKIRDDLNTYIEKFLGEIEFKAKFGVVSPKLKNILEGF